MNSKNLTSAITTIILMVSCLYNTYAQDYFAQNDWSGGPGQNYPFLATNMFDYSTNIDYSTVPGKISANFSNNAQYNAMFTYNNKIYAARNEGLFTYNTLNGNWQFETFVNMNRAKGWIIIDNMLYVLSGHDIYCTDGSNSDYGMGPNGWRYHSSVPENIHTIRCLGTFQGELFCGLRIGQSSGPGQVYRYNEKIQKWEAFGNSFEAMVVSLFEHNNEFFAGTHWSGAMYRYNPKTNSWTKVLTPRLTQITSFAVFKGKLYASSYSEANWTGKLFKYEYGTWVEAASTKAGMQLVVVGDYLYLSCRKSNGTRGEIYRTSNGTDFTLFRTLSNNENYAFMTELNNDLYYIALRASEKSAPYLYKNGEQISELHTAMLASTIFDINAGKRCNLTYKQSTPEGCGVQILLQGKESPSGAWLKTEMPRNVEHNEEITFEKPHYRYMTIIWGNRQHANPTIEEICLQNQITITANNSGKVYGENDPKLTYTITSSIGESLIIGEIDIEREPGEDIGTYTITVSGPESSLYSIKYVNGKFEIAPREISINGSFSAKNKTYNRNTNAEATNINLTLNNVMPGDNLEISNLEFDFDTERTGTNKDVFISSFEITGDKAVNYILSNNSLPSSKASILPIILETNGQFTVQNKTYDGFIAATISTSNLQLNGILANENVEIDEIVAEFESAHAASGKKVTLSSIGLIGSHASNYTTNSSSTPHAIATIYPKMLSVEGSFAAFNKEYDGTNDAEIKSSELTLNGTLSTDDIEIANIIANFESADTGTNKKVSITNIELNGGHSNNYTFDLTTLPSSTASINPKRITLGGSFSVLDKEFDGNKDAEIKSSGLLLVGVLPADIIDIEDIVAEFEKADIGNNVPVIITDVRLNGTSTMNYTLTLEGAPTAFANIVQKMNAKMHIDYKISIYPNPFNEFIFIESSLDIQKVSIRGISGNTIATQFTGNMQPIYTSGLKKGMYLITIDFKNGNSTNHKLIKQ